MEGFPSYVAIEWIDMQIIDEKVISHLHAEQYRVRRN